MEILFKILQGVAALSLLVIIHELGHFLFAKLFKCRVEKFYLFFNPWFSLFKYKKGDTEYGIGWIPLGGYVKISGMIDESMDKEQMNQPPQPWEFRTKPTWQRLLIMTGGVAVNFIMALFIYAMILYTWGQEYVPVKNATSGYDFCVTALGSGFRNGDKIISVDGVEYETIKEVTEQIVFNSARTVVVERDGQRIPLTMPENFTEQFLEASDQRSFARELYPWIVAQTVAGSPAAKADLREGDRMVAVNGVAVPFVETFITEVKKHAGAEIALTINRDGTDRTVNLAVTPDSVIGVQCKLPTQILQSNRITYGFFESFPAGISHGVDVLGGYVSNLKLIFSKAGIKNVGGFIAIANIFPTEWRWSAFWEMTAMLSIILAFMNILPIPALDGGHVLFLLYEIITGRKPSDKFMERAQAVGMILLLGLLLLANGNDIIRLVK
jgi:regulator of sigma E protease